MTRTRTPFTAADDGLLRAHVRRHGHQGQSGNEIYKQLAEQRWVKRLAPMEQAEQNRRARLQQLNRVAASAAAAPTYGNISGSDGDGNGNDDDDDDDGKVSKRVSRRKFGDGIALAQTCLSRSYTNNDSSNYDSSSNDSDSTTNNDSERFDLVAPQGKRARRAPTAAATTAEAAREPPAFNRAVPLRTDPLDFGQYVGDLCRVTGALQTECVRILAATCNNLDLGPAAVRWWRRHCTTLDPQGTDVAAEDEAVEQTWPIACWTPRRDILLQSSTSQEELKGLAIELGNEIVALLKWDVAAGGGDNEALARQLNAFLGRSEPYRKALNLVGYSDDDDDDDDDSSSSSNNQDQHMPQAYDLGIHAISLRLLFIDLARQHKWSHLVTLHS
ncbi:hypothetical protein RI367_005546 [Sorochytrium milnesiophthora]